MLRSMLIVSALLASFAFAQDAGQPSGKPAWMEACGDDFVKFKCVEKKSREEVMACLEAHASELSAKCKDFRAKAPKK